MSSETSATILIVDDNALNRRLLVTLLTAEGYRVYEGIDGEDGLAVAAGVHPDLIISDIVMPTMDGYEFVRQLRLSPEGENTQVIFYTAHFLEREARRLAQTCRVARVLIKPCEPFEILNAVAQVLSARAPPPATQAGTEFEREHLEVITNKLAQKADELAASNARLRALTALNLDLASERDPQSLIEKVCYGARQLVGARFAALCVDDAHSASHWLCVTSGLERGAGEAPPVFTPDSTALRKVYEEGSAARGRSPSPDEPIEVLPGGGFPAAQAYLAVPVQSLTRTYGVLCLTEKIGAEEFSAEDERILGTLAGQVGRIYESGSLYRELQLHAAQLQVEIEERERAAAKLRESEERFRQLAENIRDVFYVVSADLSQLLYLSPAFESIWGFRYDQERPHQWIESVHPEDRPRIVAHLKDHGRTTSDGTLEFRIIRPDGSIGWILSRHFALRDALGRPYRIVGVSTDVTERTLAEGKIRTLNRVYAILSGINGVIVRARDQQELFTDACRVAVEQGHFGLAWVGWLSDDQERLTPVAWAGEPAIAELLRREGSLPVDADATLLTAIERRRPGLCNDLMAETGRVLYRSEMLAAGIGSLVALPLTVRESVVGSLMLTLRAPRSFDETEMRLLTELAQDVSFALDHIETAERLKYLAYYDSLTGLANRALFLDRLGASIAQARASSGQLAVVLRDPERFETINETFGRALGDQLLRELAERFMGSVGDPNAVARIGAGQFAWILAYRGDRAGIEPALEDQYQAWLGPPFMLNAGEMLLSARTGVALYPEDGDDAEVLLGNAEAALKEAKSRGDSRVFFTQEINDRIIERLSMETRLRRALETEEFVLHYQPKVGLESRALLGVEALLRWNSPELGLVLPAKFIPVMEQTGIIVDVGAWVLRRACRDRSSWIELDLPAPRVAVNVSTAQLRKPDFLAVVRSALKHAARTAVLFSGPQGGLDIEVTESLLVENAAANMQTLRALRELGVGIAIDDFGTGYSSLSYLAKLPVESLKIDRSFTGGMLDDPGMMTLVSSIITLAHALNLKVIAEGVESEEQAKILRLLRCDGMQGFLVSQPLTFDQMAEYLARRA